MTAFKTEFELITANVTEPPALRTVCLSFSSRPLRNTLSHQCLSLKLNRLCFLDSRAGYSKREFKSGELYSGVYCKWLTAKIYNQRPTVVKHWLWDIPWPVPNLRSGVLFSIREGGPYEHRLTCPDIKPQHMHIRSWWVRCAIENLSCLSAVWVAGQSQNCSLCVRRLG